MIQDITYGQIFYHVIIKKKKIMPEATQSDSKKKDALYGLVEQTKLLCSIDKDILFYNK